MVPFEQCTECMWSSPASCLPGPLGALPAHHTCHWADLPAGGRAQNLAQILQLHAHILGWGCRFWGMRLRHGDTMHTGRKVVAGKAQRVAC